MKPTDQKHPTYVALLNALRQNPPPKSTTKTPKRETSKLSPPTFSENEGEYFASIGDGWERVGEEPQAGILNLHGAALLTAYVRKGKLLVDATIFSGYGLVPVQVFANQLKVEAPSWDRNYNDSALEVVNERGIPVLQIIYTNPRNVLIYGMFQAPNDPRHVTIVGPKGIDMNARTDSLSPEMYLKPIFKHPSRKYLHEEVDPR